MKPSPKPFKPVRWYGLFWNTTPLRVEERRKDLAVRVWHEKHSIHPVLITPITPKSRGTKSTKHKKKS